MKFLGILSLCLALILPSPGLAWEGPIRPLSDHAPLLSSQALGSRMRWARRLIVFINPFDLFRQTKVLTVELFPGTKIPMGIVFNSALSPEASSGTREEETVDALWGKILGAEKIRVERIQSFLASSTWAVLSPDDKAIQIAKMLEGVLSHTPLRQKEIFDLLVDVLVCTTPLLQTLSQVELLKVRLEALLQDKAHEKIFRFFNGSDKNAAEKRLLAIVESLDEGIRDYAERKRIWREALVQIEQNATRFTTLREVEEWRAYLTDLETAFSDVVEDQHQARDARHALRVAEQRIEAHQKLAARERLQCRLLPHRTLIGMLTSHKVLSDDVVAEVNDLAHRLATRGYELSANWHERWSRLRPNPDNAEEMKLFAQQLAQWIWATEEWGWKEEGISSEAMNVLSVVIREQVRFLTRASKAERRATLFQWVRELEESIPGIRVGKTAQGRGSGALVALTLGSTELRHEKGDAPPAAIYRRGRTIVTEEEGDQDGVQPSAVAWHGRIPKNKKDRNNVDYLPVTLRGYGGSVIHCEIETMTPIVRPDAAPPLPSLVLALGGNSYSILIREQDDNETMQISLREALRVVLLHSQGYPIRQASDLARLQESGGLGFDIYFRKPSGLFFFDFVRAYSQAVVDGQRGEAARLLRTAEPTFFNPLLIALQEFWAATPEQRPRVETELMQAVRRAEYDFIAAVLPIGLNRPELVLAVEWVRQFYWGAVTEWLGAIQRRVSSGLQRLAAMAPDLEVEREAAVRAVLSTQESSLNHPGPISAIHLCVSLWGQLLSDEQKARLAAVGEKTQPSSLSGHLSWSGFLREAAEHALYDTLGFSAVQLIGFCVYSVAPDRFREVEEEIANEAAEAARRIHREHVKPMMLDWLKEFVGFANNIFHFDSMGEHEASALPGKGSVLFQRIKDLWPELQLALSPEDALTLESLILKEPSSGSAEDSYRSLVDCLLKLSYPLNSVITIPWFDLILEPEAATVTSAAPSMVMRQPHFWRKIRLQEREMLVVVAGYVSCPWIGVGAPACYFSLSQLRRELNLGKEDFLDYIKHTPDQMRDLRRYILEMVLFSSLGWSLDRANHSLSEDALLARLWVRRMLYSRNILLLMTQIALFRAAESTPGSLMQQLQDKMCDIFGVSPRAYKPTNGIAGKLHGVTINAARAKIYEEIAVPVGIEFAGIGLPAIAVDGVLGATEEVLILLTKSMENLLATIPEGPERESVPSAKARPIKVVEKENKDIVASAITTVNSWLRQLRGNGLFANEAVYKRLKKFFPDPHQLNDQLKLIQRYSRVLEEVGACPPAEAIIRAFNVWFGMNELQDGAWATFDTSRPVNYHFDRLLSPGASPRTFRWESRDSVPEALIAGVGEEFRQTWDSSKHFEHSGSVLVSRDSSGEERIDGVVFYFVVPGVMVYFQGIHVPLWDAEMTPAIQKTVHRYLFRRLTEVSMQQGFFGRWMLHVDNDPGAESVVSQVGAVSFKGLDTEEMARQTRRTHWAMTAENAQTILWPNNSAAITPAAVASAS